MLNVNVQRRHMSKLSKKRKRLLQARSRLRSLQDELDIDITLSKIK